MEELMRERDVLVGRMRVMMDVAGHRRWWSFKPRGVLSRRERASFLVLQAEVDELGRRIQRVKDEPRMTRRG